MSIPVVSEVMKRLYKALLIKVGETSAVVLAQAGAVARQQRTIRVAGLTFRARSLSLRR
jgi:hypothetical protein